MWRIVDVSQPDRHLSLDRGSLVVSGDGAEIGRVPIRDIQAVVVHGHGSSVSLNLAGALAQEGVPLVLADAAHRPTALCLPVTGNYEQAARVAAQAALSDAKAKRIWRDIVRCKIAMQAETLELSGSDAGIGMRKLIRIVRPGDPENVEARAARYYWQRLLGDGFRRDAGGGGLNGPLNYGYAVLRATMARAIVAAGLTPSLGVHHRGRLNAFQLVDDLMEPLRPLIDREVWRRREEWRDGLSQDGKAVLANLVNHPMVGPDGHAPLSRVAGQMALSLSEVFTGDRKDLWLPDSLKAPAQPTFDLDGGE